MTTPTLPEFIPTVSQRQRQRRRITPQPSFLHRHADTILFLWSCTLIALLVHLALS